MKKTQWEVALPSSFGTCSIQEFCIQLQPAAELEILNSVIALDTGDTCTFAYFIKNKITVDTCCMYMLGHACTSYPRYHGSIRQGRRRRTLSYGLVEVIKETSMIYAI